MDGHWQAGKVEENMIHCRPELRKPSKTRGEEGEGLKAKGKQQTTVRPWSSQEVVIAAGDLALNRGSINVQMNDY